MDLPHDNTNLPQADDGVVNMEILEHPQSSTTESISTDLLFSLPPELLLPIFSFVGVENFRQDVRRLAVCKKWYAYARPVLLGNLRLHSREHLLSMLQTTERGPRLAAVRQMTKHIEIDVGVTLWHSGSPLERLASKLRVFAALRTLVIRTAGWSPYYQRDLRNRLISSFAAITQLTSLEIDLKTIERQQSGAHLCNSIRQCIPTLKRLRCRLPHICNNLLETPPGDLEELIISITCPNDFCTRQCFTDFVVNESKHRAILEARLVQFAASMRKPKIVRLLHHSWSLPKTYAFDAIRKRRFFLGQFPAWDADGVLLPEDWDENEESEEDEDWGSEEGKDWEEGEESYEWSDEYEDLIDEWLSE